MFFNRVTTLATCLAISIAAAAQKNIDYKFGSITAKDFDVSNSKIVNSDDGAVILYEAGSTHFVGNKKDWFSYVYTCTKRIKIIDKKAFDLATLRIGLYTKNDDAEALSDVKAVTYNLNNAAILSTSLNKDDIFTEQEDKNHILKKFTLPGVQEGSIIEYTYTITSPYTFNMPEWQFQQVGYPVLWSEYKVSIPSTLMYVYIKHGFDSFYIKKSSQGYESYQVTQPADKSSLGAQEQQLTVNAVTNNYSWAMKDIKPLNIESYISTPENYLDKIEFQLSGTYNGESTSAVANTWQAACKHFLEEEDFQQALSNDNTWIKDVPEINTAQSDLDVTKAIYYFIQNNYACTDTLNVFKQNNLFDIYRKQKGSVRSINLLLIAMLKNKGIHAQPVMLSTKEHGFVNATYPVIDRFNYLICKTVVGGKTYLLDATNPELGFGELPIKCYNGYARVIDADRPDSLYLEPDSLKNIEVSSLFLSNNENGKTIGTYKNVMGSIQSEFMREKMKLTNIEEYFKDMKREYPFEVNISNTTVDSLAQKEMPVSVQYDINFTMNDDIVYFNPIAPNNIKKENPFKAAQRFYPVEMPYCIDETYILNMEVPAGYKVDELPKSARVSLNDGEGMFEYLIQQSDGTIQLRCRTKLNKATFEPEDYETLRNFFAFIVEKENEQIVFKKQ